MMPMAGRCRIYITHHELEVLRLAYPDSTSLERPRWWLLSKRVACAYASCLERWALMNPGSDLSTVALLLAGDLRALEETR